MQPIEVINSIEQILPELKLESSEVKKPDSNLNESLKELGDKLSMLELQEQIAKQ